MTTDKFGIAGAILYSLSSVPRRGYPGTILTWDQEAACVLKTSTGQCPIATATYGAGRVVAFAHNGYVNGFDGCDTKSKADHCVLLRNAIFWATKSECRIYGTCSPECSSGKNLINTYPFYATSCNAPVVIGGINVESTKIVSALNGIETKGTPSFSIGLNHTWDTFGDQGEVIRDDVIIWTNKRTDQETAETMHLSDPRILRLLNYVYQGGAVVIGLCPWGWNSLTGRHLLERRCLFNHFMIEVGLYFTDEICGGDKNGVYPIPVIKAGGFEDLNSAFLSTARSLTFKEVPNRDHLAETLQGIRTLPSNVFQEVDKAKQLSLKLKSCPLRFSLEKLRNSVSSVHIKFPILASPITYGSASQLIKIALLSRDWKQNEPSKCLKADSVDGFPGDVSAKVRRLKHHYLTLDPDLDGWQSSGIYVPPGEVIRLRISDQAMSGYTNLEITVRIGSHTDRLKMLPVSGSSPHQLKRYPEITSARLWLPQYSAPADNLPFTVESGESRASTFEAATPFGGILYLELSQRNYIKRNTDSAITILVDGGVLNNYWNKRIYTGQIPTGEFINSYPHSRSNEMKTVLGGPWSELEGDYIILTVPTRELVPISGIYDLVDFWDQVIANELALSGQSITKKERIVHDIQISAGYMHSGYPVMAQLDVVTSKNQLKGEHLNVRTLYANPSWGAYHEFGHNRQKQDWTWSGLGEVTVNIFSLYCTHTINGIEPYSSPYFLQNCRDKAISYLKDSSQTYNSHWIKNYNIALSTYVALVHEIDWQGIADTFRYYESRSKPTLSTDQQKITEWVYATSEASKTDLRNFYRQWKWPIDDSTSAVSDISKNPTLCSETAGKSLFLPRLE